MCLRGFLLLFFLLFGNCYDCFRFHLDFIGYEKTDLRGKYVKKKKKEEFELAL